MLFKSASIGTTTDLDLQAGTIHVDGSLVALENFVLQCPSLDSAPVCLLSLNAQRIDRRGKPKVCTPPTLVARIHGSQPGEGDRQPSFASLPAQRRRERKAVDVRQVLGQIATTECRSAVRGALAYLLDVDGTVAQQAGKVLLELATVFRCPEYAFEHCSCRSPIRAMCQKRLQPDCPWNALDNVTVRPRQFSDLIESIVKQSSGAAHKGCGVTGSARMPHGVSIARCATGSRHELARRQRSIINTQRDPFGSAGIVLNHYSPAGREDLRLDGPTVAHALGIN